MCFFAKNSTANPWSCFWAKWILSFQYWLNAEGAEVATQALWLPDAVKAFKIREDVKASVIFSTSFVNFFMEPWQRTDLLATQMWQFSTIFWKYANMRNTANGGEQWEYCRGLPRAGFLWGMIILWAYILLLYVIGFFWDPGKNRDGINGVNDHKHQYQWKWVIINLFTL